MNKNELVCEVDKLLNKFNDSSIFSKDQFNFLTDHSNHLKQVCENTFQWRTDHQKEMILCDHNNPTTHSKFHQAILEQKVQFEQTMCLAKKYEDKKLDLEELVYDLEELGDDYLMSECPRVAMKIKRMNINLSFIKYELYNMETSMKYRMKELKGWQTIQNKLLKRLEDEGLGKSDIWDKEFGYHEHYFFKSINKYPSAFVSQGSGEQNNIIMHAVNSVKHAIENNLIKGFFKRSTEDQKKSIAHVIRKMGLDIDIGIDIGIDGRYNAQINKREDG